MTSIQHPAVDQLLGEVRHDENLEDVVEEVAETEEPVDLNVIEEELLYLADRVNPEVPPPIGELVGIRDIWYSIRSVGAWDSFLCRSPMLQGVPEQHKGAWAAAWGQVLTRWEGAESEEARDTALIWLGFLNQALLRRPTRGGPAGRKQVAKRFKCVNHGDWGSLVTMWLKDEQSSRERQRRREETNQQDLSKQRKQVVELLHAGLLSKAVRWINSHRVADHSNPRVQDQLQEKFPLKKRDLPASVPFTRPIDHFADLRSTLLGLLTGVAAGSGGLKNYYLDALGD